jgi:hypothetical protein
VDGLDFALYLVGGLIAGAITYLGGHVSSTKPWHKKTFMTLGILCFLLYGGAGLKNYYSTKAANVRITKAEEEARGARNDLQQTEKSNSQKLTDVLARLDALKPSPQGTQVAAKLKRDVEILKLRADATGLINSLYSDYVSWRSLDKWTEDHGPESGSIRQLMLNKDAQAFTALYEQDYRSKVIAMRDDLLRHVRNVPRRNTEVGFSYQRLDGPVFPQQVDGQLCDMIILLNEMERENGLDVSGSGIKQSLMHCEG